MNKACRLTRLDRWLLCLIAIVYSLFALHDLGVRTAPETPMTLTPDCGYCFIFPTDVSPYAMCWFDGPQPDPRQDPAVTVLYSTLDDPQNYFQRQDISFGKVFTWQSTSLNQWDMQGGQLVITLLLDREVPVMELVFVDKDGNRLLPENSSLFPGLFDEQDTLPLWLGFRNGMYFDEIYHARSAYEMLHGLYCYENTHPPLGKLLIGVGILIFGMNPFGWRIVGTLFGIAMLPLMYVFCKRMTRSTPLSALGCWLLAFDFMHFVQTRIATIDTYAVFFILLMYLLMYLFFTEQRLRYLALSGLFFGLGAASKWTCLYAGAGLALIWAWYWVKNARLGPKAFLKNCGFCLVFFVLLPCCIYYLAYLPYGRACGYRLFSAEYLKMVLDNQSYMFHYHSGVVATHPYSSRWYQWLLDIRPILYYLQYLPDGMRSSFGAFVNPALCWGGFIALFVLLYLVIARRDETAAFILLGYLAQLVPWMFVSRLTFEYHYFPCTVFLVLAMGYVFSIFCRNGRYGRRYVWGFALGSLALFALFYPALSGAPVNNALATRLLGWLPSWPF